MSISNATLLDTLTPLRDGTVQVILAALTRAIDAGAEVETEPVRRDPAGDVARNGSLALPSRGDLSVTLDGRTLIQRVEGPEPDAFDPIIVPLDDVTGIIRPFRWEAAVLSLSGGQRELNWEPMRLWFLEWFQPRVTGLSPELSAVLHALEGPFQRGADWRIVLDLGSAPTECVPALFEAAETTGCASATLGAACVAGQKP